MATIGVVLAEPLGHAYAKAYFPEDYRAKMEDMVVNIRAAFKARLEANDWMDEATRERRRLASWRRSSSYVGYPDQWRDFSSIRLDPTDLFGNVMQLTEFENADAIKMLGEPRREWMWTINAHVINAGYAPPLNSITFPAAILQSPFFDPHADPAVNYGAIGAVIGHELGHGIRRSGQPVRCRRCIAQLVDRCIAGGVQHAGGGTGRQYNGYSPIEGMNMNGALTLGENIGDLGGISIAYDAYRIHVAKEDGGKAPVIDGFTGDQRFFLVLGAAVARSHASRTWPGNSCCPTRTARTNSVSLRCGISSPGTRRSTCRKATRCICRPQTA